MPKMHLDELRGASAATLGEVSRRAAQRPATGSLR
jgi:hypothetical protein